VATETCNKSREEILRLASSPPAKMMAVGPRKIGKHELIVDVLQSLASDQDMLEVDGSVDGARQSHQFLKTSPIAGPIRALLVDGRKNFSDPAQDAYLKVCEDTPESSVIIVVVDDDGVIRSPLASRLDIVRFCVLSDDEVREFLRAISLSTDDFAVSVVRGRTGLCDANLGELKTLHAMACEKTSGGTWPLAAPRLISTWSKLNDDTKDAVLATCELVIRTSMHVGALARFVDVMRSTPSANAELHWWRFCME
jgi:DNA polymerase III delta prime subunit